MIRSSFARSSEAIIPCRITPRIINQDTSVSRFFQAPFLAVGMIPESASWTARSQPAWSGNRPFPRQGLASVRSPAQAAVMAMIFARGLPGLAASIARSS